MANFPSVKGYVQFCWITQHVIMFSCSAKLLKYFAHGPAQNVAGLQSEILDFQIALYPCCNDFETVFPERRLANVDAKV